MKYLTNRNPYIINDDKPALRIIENEIYVYGTPFSGDTNINENKRAKLKGISFIKRSEVNLIKKINCEESLKLFFEHSINSPEKESISKFLSIYEIIEKKIPMYELACNISKEAFELSYKTMTKSNMF